MVACYGRSNTFSLEETCFSSKLKWLESYSIAAVCSFDILFAFETRHDSRF